MKKLLSVLLALMMVFPLTATAGGADSAKATTLRLAQTENAVTVTNSGGNDVSVTAGMKLYSGNQVTTGAKSYAYISLDDTKAAKLDASSKAEISQSGNKLELKQATGSLFFNVSEPLRSDETMNIRTSTMTTGIRGTSGWVMIIDKKIAKISLLTGQVEICATDPDTGEQKSATLVAGQTATSYVQENGQLTPGGENAEIIIETFEEGDVPGFVSKAIAEDPQLQEQIAEQTELSVPLIIGEADQKLAADEKKAEEEQAIVDDNIAAMDATREVDPLFEEKADSSGGGGGGGGSSSPTPTAITLDLSNPALGLANPGTITGAELQGYLNSYDNITLTNGTRGGLMVGQTETLTVAAGKSLSADNSVNIDNAGTMNIDGTFTTGAGNFTNNGAINNNSSNTFNNYSALTNWGTINNTATGKINNYGSITNAGNGGIISNAGTVANLAGGALDVSVGNFTSSGSGSISNAGTLTYNSNAETGFKPIGIVNTGTLIDSSGTIGAVVTDDGGIVCGVFLSESFDDNIPVFSWPVNATMQLLESFSSTVDITINASGACIDLNSKKLDMGNNSIKVSGGSLTVKDSGSGGSIVGTNTRAGVIEVGIEGGKGAFTLESGTISGPIAIQNNAYGVLNIKGGSVEGSSAGPLVSEIIYGVLNYGTAVMSGGTVSSSNQAIYVRSGAHCTIEGGTVSSSGSVTLQMAADVNFTGGSITNSSENGTAVSLEEGCTFTMSGDASITANTTGGTGVDCSGGTFINNGVSSSGTDPQIERNIAAATPVKRATP